MSNKTDSQRIGYILSNARHQSNVSQEEMSLALGVSKQSIINWEKGTSSPKFKQLLQWFEYLGINIHRPLMELIYPDLYKNIQKEDSNIKTIIAIQTFIETMPPQAQECLAYLLIGEHGSDVMCLLQLFTAYLHLPIQCRVSIARSIAESFDMYEKRNELVCKDYTMPDKELLHNAIQQCKEAVYSGKNGYSVKNKS